MFFRKRGQAAASSGESAGTDGGTAAARPAEPPSEEYIVIASGVDKQFYWQNNADVAAAGVDPVQHYIESGWKEGRNPSDQFNTVHYLSRNADVVASGMNPLYHYLQYGRAEGRLPLPNALTPPSADRSRHSSMPTGI